MKSIVKTALTLALILPVAGCYDFGWSKKTQESEKTEVATPAQAEEASKCSHKGCTKNHRDGKHLDEVKTQSVDENGNYIEDEITNMDEENNDINMDENAEISMDENSEDLV